MDPHPPASPPSTRFPVRYHETDQMGVVHHAVYVTWFEAARVEAMRALGIDYAELERRGVLLAVVEVETRHHAPARFGDDVRIESWVAELDRVRVRVRYQVFRAGSPDGELLLCTGSTLLAHVDRTLRPRRLPQDVEEALRRWVVAGP